MRCVCELTRGHTLLSQELTAPSAQVRPWGGSTPVWKLSWSSERPAAPQPPFLSSGISLLWGKVLKAQESENIFLRSCMENSLLQGTSVLVAGAQAMLLCTVYATWQPAPHLRLWTSLGRGNCSWRLTRSGSKSPWLFNHSPFSCRLNRLSSRSKN